MTSVFPPPALTRRAPKPAAVSIVPVAPLVALFIVSLMSNLLMLVGPLFMLQVYDRVLASQSLPTLTVLTILVCALYGFYAFIEAVRARMATRFGISSNVPSASACWRRRWCLCGRWRCAASVCQRQWSSGPAGTAPFSSVGRDRPPFEWRKRD